MVKRREIIKPEKQKLRKPVVQEKKLFQIKKPALVANVSTLAESFMQDKRLQSSRVSRYCCVISASTH